MALETGRKDTLEIEPAQDTSPDLSPRTVDNLEKLRTEMAVIGVQYALTNGHSSFIAERAAALQASIAAELAERRR
ncbi:MAG: hypothetical protein AAGL24_19705 [Pseudomonadota bacterium]